MKKSLRKRTRWPRSRNQLSTSPNEPVAEVGSPSSSRTEQFPNEPELSPQPEPEQNSKGTNTQSTREDSQDILNLEIEELSNACAAYSKANGNIVSFNFEELKWEEGKTLSLDQIKIILNGIFCQEAHRAVGQKRWFEQIVDFCVKLYPLSNFSLRLLAPAAEVGSLLPVKGAAVGLGLIFQVLHDEKEQKTSFISQFTEVEYQLDRLTKIPRVEGDFTGHLEQKSLDLVIAILKFIRVAVQYFCRNFFVKVLKSVVNTEKPYDEAQRSLNSAIKQYDQAIIDLIASLSIGNWIYGAAYLVSMSATQEERRGEQVEKLLNWLQPPHWLTESYREFHLHQRTPKSLEWVMRMPQFVDWRTSVLGSEEQFLWITGPPGIGKSVLSSLVIDILQKAYPDSCVLYFFCKAGIVGANNVLDIIRTLAYQASPRNGGTHSLLVNLLQRRFSVDNRLGIEMLANKLLLSPLSCFSQPGFIVLDGLDELETKRDEVSKRTEFSLFVSCLARANFRVLFVTRPICKIYEIIPSIKMKEISEYDNSKDIREYVASQLCDKLRNGLREEGENPDEYFETYAQGIFLWVVLAIEQLKAANSKTTFRRNLRELSNASGDMEGLYLSILTRFDVQDQTWVREILNLIMVSKRSLKVLELQKAAELLCQDEHFEFESFVRYGCGSLLRCVRPLLGLISGVGPDVEFVHETFRAFLQKSDRCPDNFKVDLANAHETMAIACFRCLSDDNFFAYASCNIAFHLSRARSQSAELLASIHQFFSILEALPVPHYYGVDVKDIPELKEFDAGIQTLNINFDNPFINSTLKWLSEWQLGRHQERGPDLQPAIDWHHQILRTPLLLREYVGKAAGRVWLYSPDLQNPLHIGSGFRVALKQYLLTAFSGNKEDAVSHLGITSFRGLVDWIDGPKHKRIRPVNVGIAFAAIGKWEAATCEYLRAIDEKDASNDIWRLLEGALDAKGDHTLKISLFKDILDQSAISFSLLEKLSPLFRNGREFYGAIKTCQRALELDANCEWACRALIEIFVDLGHHDRAIEICNSVIDAKEVGKRWRTLAWRIVHRDDFHGALKIYESVAERLGESPLSKFNIYSHSYDILRRLSGVLSANRSYNEIVDMWKRMIQIDPSGPAYISFASIYRQLGDFDNAIRLLEDAIKIDPDHQIKAWTELSIVYFARGDYELSIAAVQKEIGFRTNPSIAAYRRLTDIYVAMGDVDGANKAWKKAVELDPSEWILETLPKPFEGTRNPQIMFLVEKLQWDYDESAVWNALSEVFLSAGEHQFAINASLTAIHYSPNGFYETGWVCLRDALIAQSDIASLILILSHETERNPESTWSWQQLANALVSNGNVPEAIKMWDRAISLSSNPLHWASKAELLMKEQQFEAALKACKNAIEIDPTSAESWKVLSNLYAQSDDPEHSISCAKRMTELDPTPPSWDHLLGLYFATNDVKGALEVWNAMDKNLFGAISFAYLGLESIDDDTVPINDLFLESLRWVQLVKSFHSDMTVERSKLCGEAIRLYSRALQFRQHLKWKEYLISENRSRQSDGKLHAIIAEAYGFEQDYGRAFEALQKALEQVEDNKWIHERREYYRVLNERIYPSLR